MLAKDIMVQTIISVTPDNGVLHAARLMLDSHVSGLPVIDGDGNLNGILTEGDLLRRAELGTAATHAQNKLVGDIAAREYIKSHSWRVGDVMTKQVVTAEENAPVDHLAAIMSANGFKRLPIMSAGRLVGIVSRSDLLRALFSVPRDNSARGDAAIQRAVATRLYNDLNLDPALVSVTAHDGNVRISGRVATETERQAAVVATETVEGVRGVHNDLQAVDPAL
jgi:CBS domain-containing protein